MNDNATVVDATVVPVETPVTNSSLDAIVAQETIFKAQLDKVKKDMAILQQQFETLKTHGTKLEGALESLQLLKTTLTK